MVLNEDDKNLQWYLKKGLSYEDIVAKYTK